MSVVTSKICTLPRKEQEKAIEDLWSQAHVLQRITYLLSRELEEAFDESRGKINGPTVTLTFARNLADVVRWLSDEAWSKAVDLLEILDDMNSETEAEAEPIRMTGGQRNG